MSEGFGNSPTRREDLASKHDSKSVGLKFNMLTTDLKTSLDNALNKVGLNFEQCFGESFLDALEDAQRKELSSLNGTLILNQNTKKPNEEVIKAIVEVLNS